MKKYRKIQKVSLSDAAEAVSGFTLLGMLFAFVLSALNIPYWAYTMVFITILGIGLGIVTFCMYKQGNKSALLIGVILQLIIIWINIGLIQIAIDCYQDKAFEMLCISWLF